MKLKQQIIFLVIFAALGLLIILMAFEPGYINLIENPSFEVDDDLDSVPDCWILITNYPTYYYLDSQENMVGDVTLKMETYCVPGQLVGEGGASMYCDVKPNTTYTISYYVKTDSPEYVLFHPGIVEYDADGNGLGQHFTYFWLSQGWQRKEFTFTTSSGAFEIKAIAAVWANYTETVEGWYEGEFYTSWIDGIQLEEEVTASPFHITFISCPFVLPATIDIDPDTLELKSEGERITCYVELPEGFDVGDIDVSTILLNDTIYAELAPVQIGDYDEDYIADLMVKFDRQAVIDYLESVGVRNDDEVEFIVTGERNDGTSFEGRDTIRVINSF